ncbi:MAG: hypothetical protein AB7K64_17680 [Variibacter sp.]
MADEMSAGCAGKPDGTPCGHGGKCIGGECWYAVNMIAGVGEGCAGKPDGTMLSSNPAS